MPQQVVRRALSPSQTSCWFGLRADESVTGTQPRQLKLSRTCCAWLGWHKPHTADLNRNTNHTADLDRNTKRSDHRHHRWRGWLCQHQPQKSANKSSSEVLIHPLWAKRSRVGRLAGTQRCDAADATASAVRHNTRWSLLPLRCRCRHRRWWRWLVRLCSSRHCLCLPVQEDCQCPALQAGAVELFNGERGSLLCGEAHSAPALRTVLHDTPQGGGGRS